MSLTYYQTCIIINRSFVFKLIILGSKYQGLVLFELKANETDTANALWKSLGHNELLYSIWLVDITDYGTVRMCHGHDEFWNFS